MAEIDMPQADGAGSYDADNTKSEDVVTGKRRRKVIVGDTDTKYPSSIRRQ